MIYELIDLALEIYNHDQSNICMTIVSVSALQVFNTSSSRLRKWTLGSQDMLNFSLLLTLVETFQIYVWARFFSSVPKAGLSNKFIYLFHDFGLCLTLFLCFFFSLSLSLSQGVDIIVKLDLDGTLWFSNKPITHDFNSTCIAQVQIF